MSKILLTIIASVFAFNVSLANADDHKEGDATPAEQTEEKKDEASKENQE